MIFLFFVLMTLLEITVLISVGQAIGSLSTILLIIATAFIGSRLLKQQGWATMARAQQNISEGQQPAGAFITLSGFFSAEVLMTPLPRFPFINFNPPVCLKGLLISLIML